MYFIILFMKYNLKKNAKNFESRAAVLQNAAQPVAARRGFEHGPT